MEENVVLTNESAEDTLHNPAWEVVPELEDEAEELWEEAETELKRGIAAVKEWLHNTLYEAGRVFREHKKAILTIVGVVAGVAAVAGVLWAVLKKKD